MKSIARIKDNLTKPIASYTGRGLTSRREVTVNLYKAEPGEGIVFAIPELDCYAGRDEPLKEGGRIFIPANTDYVISTIRNTCLGIGRNRVCFVEHILCAAALCGIDDLLIEVLGYEVPLENGSCDLWVDLFERNGLKKAPPEATIELKEAITLQSGKRLLMAIPDDSFSISHMMDFNHPRVGRIWRSWTPA
ncbi:MAG: UDP-3-O-acyl-N-acetylglucosamine deacetylase, partial [Candidatus Obscuribacterales bacterium]|nr:UDP-3-O-acyl-N-acetylglucosamine deacetylase [Candidatus Obscuribacterales bacterium]